MKQLQVEVPHHVRQIKTLQLSFSTEPVTYMCPIGCGDIRTATNFIASIDSLESLSVLSYEADSSELWAAIRKHAGSLKSLSIHTPPQMWSDTWTPAMLDRHWHGFRQLRRVELDVTVPEAEAYLAGKHPLPPALDTVTKLDQIKHLIVNIILSDEASDFAPQHTWNAMGCISFPPTNPGQCKKLAEEIFTNFQSAQSALEGLEVRFTRRCWDDRCQFWTLAQSVHARLTEKGVEINAGSWGSYLPEWPTGDEMKQLTGENRSSL